MCSSNLSIIVQSCIRCSYPGKSWKVELESGRLGKSLIHTEGLECLKSWNLLNVHTAHALYFSKLIFMVFSTRLLSEICTAYHLFRVFATTPLTYGTNDFLNFINEYKLLMTLYKCTNSSQFLSNQSVHLIHS